MIGVGLCIISPWTVSGNKIALFKTKEPRSFAQMHGQTCYWLRMTCGSASLGICVDLFLEIPYWKMLGYLWYQQVYSLEFGSLRIQPIFFTIYFLNIKDFKFAILFQPVVRNSNIFGIFTRIPGVSWSNLTSTYGPTWSPPFSREQKLCRACPRPNTNSRLCLLLDFF